MPLVTAAPEPSRRHALVIGTATYASGWDDIGDGVRAEMAAAKRLLLDVLGYQRETFNEILDPDQSELAKAVARWRAAIKPGPDDWLLVYYTGHGVERAGMLNLITRDVEVELQEAAPNAQVIVAALLAGEPMPRHALLALDTCHSAVAHLDTAAIAARLRESQGGATRDADFHVIATARSIGQAFVGHFMQSLHVVVTQGLAAGSGEEYLQPTAAIEQVNRLLSERGGQRASYSGAGASSLRFLPNPGWLPSLRLAMGPDERRRVLHRIQSGALRGHWRPRARGVSTDGDAGWLFTGRGRALRRIIDWLTDDAGRGSGLLVKGLAGSGKSAVLARIATLADPGERALAVAAGALADTPKEELPPVGIVDVAVHARAKDAAKIALEIAAALELDLSGAVANPEAATVTALAARAGRTVIVVDALDEAVRPADCAALLRAVLQKAGGLRLLVGLREGKDSGHLTQLLGPRFTEMNLDDAEWREPKDMAAYVERYLRSTPGSPYSSVAEDRLQRLAHAIASRANGSFLVASATAHALVARADVVDSAGFTLPENVGQAFDLDLARFEGLAGEQLRHVLTALACGEGRGVPPEEWLAIAQALSDGELTDADIRRWSEEAAFYIVADEEFGAPVRRLYHEEFATHLRRVVDTPREAAIADALERRVPTPRMGSSPVWEVASPYVLAFYPKHLWRARCAKALSELTTSPRWIQAKRDRFGDLAPILSDLDLAIDLARDAEPPDLRAIVHACAICGRFATTAPALVIDVLAGLGERARAELMAESVEFPLDRCQAFSLLAERYAKAGDHVRAISCVRAAEHAARAILGHYQTMALYWVVRAARAAGQSDATRRVSETIHRTLERASEALVPTAANKGVPTGVFGADIAAYLWESDRWGEMDMTFALPHWLFWAAMSLRDLGDADGLASVRAVLAASRPRGNNLVLQIAAVAGDVGLLRSVRPEGIVKPGNLALALIEAGLAAEFDALRAAGAFAEPGLDDSRKRYAWALARRGDFAEAVKVATAIEGDLEEQARALYRVAQVATDDAARQSVVAAASALRVKVREATAPDASSGRPGRSLATTRTPRKKQAPRHVPIPLEAWRIESWLAAAMLAAGRPRDAKELAEAVCSAGIVPSRAASLAMATPRTAYAKNHVRLDSASSPDEGLRERVLQIAATSGIAVALEYLYTQGASARSRAAILAQLARAEQDSTRAYSLWLDAIIASRTAGRAALGAVIADGESILARAGVGETSASLLSQMDRIDATFDE